MKNIRKMFSFLFIIAIIFSAFPALTEGKLLIVTTNFPCYDTARVIAGDSAEVIMLLPPGSESHSYEPTPSDIITIQEADLFFYVGGESDVWVDSILESMGDDAPPVLRMSDCVETLAEETSASMAEEHEEHGEGEEEEEGEEMDEHVWTSPVNMMEISKCLAEKLCEIAPEYAEVFRTRLEAYLTELEALDADFRTAVSEGKRKKIVFADRFPFLYFVTEYGLSYDAAFPGCSEDAEPSVRTVISLIDMVREEEIPVVFYIEFSSCRTADIVAEETGAAERLFHSCHNVSEEDIAAGVSYLSLMRDNLSALKEALN